MSATSGSIGSTSLGSKPAPVAVPTWKRVLDVTLVLLTAPVWVPLMGVIALMIKIVSPGPVFFRQERIGFRESRFICLKLRSMHVNAETNTHQSHLATLLTSDTPMQKMDKEDKRLIPGARLLRATGLDELPQLINVLRGEMSLVGPRPCTVYEFEKYQDWQRERFNALPGLTGLWQVSGKNRTTFTQMIQLDIHYTRISCLALDLGIMFKTFPALLGQVLDNRLEKFFLPAAKAARRGVSPAVAAAEPELKPNGIAR